MTTPDLTVVVAQTSADASLAEALAAIELSARGIAIEVLVVGDAPSSLPLASARHITCPGAYLTPARWGAGARVARGRAIAFTTDQMRVGIDWAHSLMTALDTGVVGVGGPIALAPHVDSATAAAHLVRFSAFLPGGHPAAHAVADVAGDNAAYDRVSVQREADLLRAGFWEVEFHRRFAAAGRQLRMVPDAVATLVGPVRTLPLARQRLAHAREYGMTRVRDHQESVVRIVLSAPLVPFVLFARIRRRAAIDPEARRRFRDAAPRIVLLTFAWAAGEAIGALCSVSRRAHRAQHA